METAAPASEPTHIRPEEFEELMLARRQAFIAEAIDKQLMSAEFAASGIIDRFAVNAARGKDPLIHIFRGDWRGGVHHLPTYTALDVPAGEVASMVWDPNKRTPGTDDPVPWPAQYQSYKGRQTERENGTYDLFHVRTGDLHPITGEVSVHDKRLGSSMFPDRWSMEQVILAITAVATLEPTKYNEKIGVYTHIGIIDGVKIEVDTDKDGKITTAYPTLRQPGGRPQAAQQAHTVN